MSDALKEKTALARIDALERATTDELKRLWKEQTGREAPAYSRAYLLSRLAHRAQQVVFEGGLSERTKARLEVVLTEEGYHPIDAKRIGTQVKVKKRGVYVPPGTTITKLYGGQVFKVLALDNGKFELEGKVFSSLSGAAKAITGTHVPGPGFFGLKEYQRHSRENRNQAYRDAQPKRPGKPE